MTERLACFKGYDIRGRVPEQLNPEMAESIGRAYALEVKPAGPVAVGRDVRLSSPELSAALRRGLNQGGAHTRDIGVCGTEMVYFAAARPGTGGGIMVTASHNPSNYNGMKFVRAGAVPISGDSGLFDLERRVREQDLGTTAAVPGVGRTEDVLAAYIDKVLSFVEPDRLQPFKIVVNAGNGCAGPVVDALAPRLPFQLVRVQHEVDGTFPNGVPNPLLEKNRAVTADAVRREAADFGVAWDGDFDRCFFFDEKGDFVDGYYMVGLLAQRMLAQVPGGRVIHDPRMTWNTIEMVEAAGGTPIQSKTGHAFIKERMRAEDAVYGGEMSAHHYFRDFAYCDSGMVPWLITAAIRSETNMPLSALIAERRRRFPSSGEINTRVPDAGAVIDRVEKEFAATASRLQHVDGLSMEFDDRWRFNLRASQTEPILRLNVETHADSELLAARTQALLALIQDTA